MAEQQQRGTKHAEVTWQPGAEQKSAAALQAISGGLTQRDVDEVISICKGACKLRLIQYAEAGTAPQRQWSVALKLAALVQRVDTALPVGFICSSRRYACTAPDLS